MQTLSVFCIRLTLTPCSRNETPLSRNLAFSGGLIMRPVQSIRLPNSEKAIKRAYIMQKKVYLYTLNFIKMQHGYYY